MAIKTAQVKFNENGTPLAQDFGDVYFSDNQGLAETEYVFLANNALPERWRSYAKANFVIAETGFGTGLNFLVTLQKFEQYCAHHPESKLRLQFISTEKHPLLKADLALALALFPNLGQLAKKLIADYPLAIEGCHRLHFLNGRVILDLWLGDVQEILPKIVCSQEGLVDAWYLDGFAPSKNPGMWNDTLYKQLARLARQDCTIATFTAAGAVRRGLIAAGFQIEKRPGHGRKREMLAGRINGVALGDRKQRYLHKPYFTRCTASSSPKEVAIIGGGLAGANSAYALSKKGFTLNLYCQEQGLAKGASGNPQGALYPQLNAEAGHASQIHALCYTFALKHYRDLLAKGHGFSHQWCGVLQLAFNTKTSERYQNLIKQQAWPRTLVDWLSAEQAQERAGLTLPYSGLFYPHAGWINPRELVSALCQAAEQQSECRVHANKKLIALRREGEQWLMSWQDGSEDRADIVVMATGSESPQLPYLENLPFRLVRGQVEAIPSQGELAKLSTVLCHKGYLTPAFAGQHALGSSYLKNDLSCEYRFAEQQSNLQMHQNALADCEWVHEIRGENTGRAAIRCSSPDHLPLVGAVPDTEWQKKHYAELYKALANHHYPLPIDYHNLFMLCGLGSRGLTTAPLLAELLASQIAGESLPMADELLNALMPNRFLVKALIRRQSTV